MSADAWPAIGFMERRGYAIESLDALTGTITATGPAAGLERLSARRDVRGIEPAPRLKELSLANKQLELGATDFWNAGFLGGKGSADTTRVDIGLIENYAAQSDHPTYAGLTFQRPVGAPTVLADPNLNASRHATAVSSVMLGLGARDCSLCQPKDAAETGTARGASSLMEAAYVPRAGKFDAVTWLAGVDQTEQGPNPRFLPGATSPAKVVNISLGSASGGDDDRTMQLYDRGSELYGILMVAAAGNGAGAQAITSPGAAPNVLTAGGMFVNSLVSSSDDTWWSGASIGPTVGGRKKPDIVAPGPSELAEPRFRTTNKLWDYSAGTSYSSAYTTGASALLIGSGVSDPVAVKAVLINSARPGRRTPSEAMGTQTTWQPNWGWGSLDLASALTQRSYWRSGSVAGGHVRFYRTTGAGATDRSTLVWQRRGSGCVGTNCSPVLALTDLDLSAFEENGTPVAASSSKIDNVEQVRLGTGTRILKLAARSSVMFGSAEPYALTATHHLDPLTVPAPSVTLSATPTATDGTSRVTAVSTNTSDGVSAAFTTTLAPGDGVTLADGSGPLTQHLGTVAPGAVASATWLVHTTGPATLSATTTATAFEETFNDTKATTLQAPPRGGAGGNLPPPPPAAACADSIDNDLDDKIDYPSDLGCTSATDDSESPDPPPPPPPPPPPSPAFGLGGPAGCVSETGAGPCVDGKALIGTLAWPSAQTARARTPPRTPAARSP